MSNRHPKIDKELALERLVLFSDAVFAIAITLLVIDIKWPEGHEETSNATTWEKLRPTFLQFMAFAFSFFNIGRSWSIHLKLFRYLKNYDQGLLIRNLTFLFFIVMFPFSASGISGHLQGEFFFPAYIYMVNLSLLGIFHFILCQYIFYQRPELVEEGDDAIKKYLFAKSKYSAVIQVVLTLIVIIGLNFFSKNLQGFLICFLPVPVIAFWSKGKLKKLKPIGYRE